MRSLSGATILITGGTGSFGNRVARHLLDLNPAQIRIFSRDEKKQWEMQRRWPQFRYIIGDVRDAGRLDEALAHQTWLEGRMQVVGDPDPYVLEELSRIHRALGDDDKAASYARRLGLAAPQP